MIYYDESIFEDWSHEEHSWYPSKNEKLLRYPNSTSVNKFHICVRNGSYYADLYDGPHVQEVRLWKDARKFGAADESKIIGCPEWPYVCFLAILRDPEKFL